MQIIFKVIINNETLSIREAKYPQKNYHRYYYTLFSTRKTFACQLNICALFSLPGNQGALADYIPVRD